MQAFDEIVRSHVDPVYRITLGITGNEADARDASQDAFISAWRALPGLKEADRFDAWLTSIAVNASRMQLRRRRRVRELRLLPADAAIVADARSDEGNAVLEAISKLPLDQRELVVLHHLADRPLDEIATSLGIPVGTVKSRLAAARRDLRKALKGDDR